MKNLPTYTEAVDAEALALARASDPSARCHASVHAGKRTSGHDCGACNFSAIR